MKSAAQLVARELARNLDELHRRVNRIAREKRAPRHGVTGAKAESLEQLAALAIEHGIAAATNPQRTLIALRDPAPCRRCRREERWFVSRPRAHGRKARRAPLCLRCDAEVLAGGIA